MRDLSKLSDQEINMRVAKIKFPELKYHAPKGVSCIDVLDGHHVQSYNWVFDEALAFRLMVDNKISPIYSNGFDAWIAEHSSVPFQPNWNKNPNRAIAECYLLMNGVDK